jgi:hypothetical protein
MANIKLQGNTKIQGKAFFNLQEETVPFSPDQITGLRGWYDYTYGVYNTNANDTTDDQYAYVSYWVYSSGNIQTPPQSLINGKKSYGGGSLRWENNAWTLTYLDTTGDDGDQYVTVTASGDTQYPWQANWFGTGNIVTRVTNANSVLATNNQTVAKWANKVGVLGNPNGGHMIQNTLNSQPIFRGDRLEFATDYLQTNFEADISAERTYYVVLKKPGTNCNILASSSSLGSSSRRNALIYSSSSDNYGLAQGGTAKYSSNSIPSDNNYRIVTASFNSVANGNIKINNETEESLSGFGNNFTSSPILYLGNTTTFTTNGVKEILFFEGAHTSQQKTQVINYLNAKYNLF